MTGEVAARQREMHKQYEEQCSALKEEVRKFLKDPDDEVMILMQCIVLKKQEYSTKQKIFFSLRNFII